MSGVSHESDAERLEEGFLQPVLKLFGTRTSRDANYQIKMIPMKRPHKTLILLYHCKPETSSTLLIHFHVIRNTRKRARIHGNRFPRHDGMTASRLGPARMIQIWCAEELNRSSFVPCCDEPKSHAAVRRPTKRKNMGQLRSTPGCCTSTTPRGSNPEVPVKWSCWWQ